MRGAGGKVRTRSFRFGHSSFMFRPLPPQSGTVNRSGAPARPAAAMPRRRLDLLSILAPVLGAVALALVSVAMVSGWARADSGDGPPRLAVLPAVHANPAVVVDTQLIGG